MMRHKEPYPRRQFVRTALIWVPTYVLGKRLVDAAENVKAVGAVAKANVKAVGAVAEANIKAVGAVDNTGGGGTCPADGSPSQQVTINEGGIAFGHNTDRYYAGLAAWSDASARVICKLRFKLSLNTGSITGKTYKAAIYSMTGTALNAELGVSSGIAGSDAWDSTDVIFTMPDVNVSASTNYAFVIYMDGAADAANFANVRYDDVSALISGNMAVWNTVKVEDVSIAGGEPNIGIYFKA